MNGLEPENWRERVWLWWMVVRLRLKRHVVDRPKRLDTCLYNSRFWYNIYYKHTRKHKAERKAVRDAVLKRRKEIIGR